MRLGHRHMEIMLLDKVNEAMEREEKEGMNAKKKQS